MRVVLGEGERAALGAAAAAEPRVRVWRRYRAILLLAEQGPEAVARALGCSRASVYGWAAAGGVWRGDETTRREFPPLRAAWARRGQQAEVVISGRNARRVLHGLLNVATGERVRLLRERGRGPDCAAAVAELGRLRPGVPKLLAWDNAPPHHARAAREAAAGAGVEIAWLPFRSPELNPCEDLWRHLKAAVAANRAYPSVDEL